MRVDGGAIRIEFVDDDTAGKRLSVRVQPYYDGTNDVSKWRLDLLYGRKLIDPRLAVRSSGT